MTVGAVRVIALRRLVGDQRTGTNARRTGSERKSDGSPDLSAAAFAKAEGGYEHVAARVVTDVTARCGVPGSPSGRHSDFPET